MSREEEVSRLSKIAVVRHGDDDYDFDKLTESGKSRIKQSGIEIKERSSNSETAIILTSTANRAKESANIIAEILACPIEANQLLYSSSRQRENLEGAYQLIQSIRNRANLAVIVTHLEYACELPKYLIRVDWDMDLGPNYLEKGECILIDYNSKTVDRF